MTLANSSVEAVSIDAATETLQELIPRPNEDASEWCVGGGQHHGFVRRDCEFDHAIPVKMLRAATVDVHRSGE